MVKSVLAVLSMAMIAGMAAVTVAFTSGQRTHDYSAFEGAGETITQSGAPTTLDTPSAAPVVKATPYGG